MVYADMPTSVHDASVRGDLRSVKFLVETKGVDPGVCDQCGRTAVHYAADAVRQILVRRDMHCYAFLCAITAAGSHAGGGISP